MTEPKQHSFAVNVAAGIVVACLVGVVVALAARIIVAIWP